MKLTFDAEGSFPDSVGDRLLDWWWDESENPGGFMAAWNGDSDYWLGVVPTGTVIQYRHEAGGRRIVMWFPPEAQQPPSLSPHHSLRAAFIKTVVMP